MPEFKNREEFEEWFRKLNLYNTDEGESSMKIDELIEKAKKDPFYNPALRKKKPKKESKPEKEFRGYNWTTQKKMAKGRTDTIKELNEKAKRSKPEEIKLKRLQNLQKWYKWALEHHKAGKSDKWIHEETVRRKEAKSSK